MVIFRPILTYAAPAWFKTPPSMMEQLCKFERRCLRACTGLNRTPESHYQKYYYNKKLYETADIPRIDNFMIGLTGDHYAHANKIKNNSFIQHSTFQNDNYLEKCCSTGFTPPELFIFLDRLGLVQNHCNIPLLYHSAKRKNDFTITLEAPRESEMRFSTAIPDFDKFNFKRTNTKLYWWLKGTPTIRKLVSRKSSYTEARINYIRKKKKRRHLPKSR